MFINFKQAESRPVAPEDKRYALLLEQFKMAHELHKHEDNLTWSKFNYFITVNGILISVLAALVTNKDPLPNLKVVGITMATFGTLICFVWCLIQARNLGYHLVRVNQAKLLELELAKYSSEHPILLYSVDWYKDVVSRNWLYGFVFSSRRVVITLTLLATAFWFAVVLNFLYSY